MGDGIRLSDNEAMVLDAIGDTEGLSYSFAGIALRMESFDRQLDRAGIRRACRSLARKGLVKFSTGLWTEEGEPAGSGYGITDLGATMLETVRHG